MGFAWDGLDTPMSRAFGQPPTSANQALAREMHGRWVSFIANGMPQYPGLVTWPAFSRSLLQVRMGNGPTTVERINDAELALWKPDLQH